MTFLVLDSGTMAATARLRLEAAGAVEIVLIRKQALGGPQWHALDARDVAERLESAQDDARVNALVTLDRMNEVPQTNVGDPVEEGVVVDGERVVDFSFPAMAAPPTNTRGGGGPALAPPPPVTPPPPPPPPSPPMAAPPAAPSDLPNEFGGGLDSTFTAHTDIEAPTMVGADEEFLVAIGLSHDPIAESPGPGILIEDLDDDSPTLNIDVHLVGDFVVSGSGGAARTLEVDRATMDHLPVAFKVKPGTPPPSFDPADEIWIGRVMVLFSYKGAPCGQSWREVRVNMTGARSNTLASERVPPGAGSTPVAPQTAPVPDLTIKLMHTPSGSSDGLFSLVLTSPHFSDLAEPEEVSIGSEPQLFSGKLISEVNQHVNDGLSDDVIDGLAHDVTDNLPDSFWTSLRQVWDAVKAAGADRIPDVLLLTDDPYVPWELAWMDEPLDDAVPPYLGAQVNIGRWFTDDEQIPVGAPLDVKALGVVIGHYEGARGVAPLPKAKAEGEALTGSYNARAVDANDDTIDEVLTGRLGGDDPFEFEAIHFAGHGESDPEKKEAFVMLSNGSQLPDSVFRSPDIAKEKQAFLFLNACQVGTAHDMLGSYAGIAGNAMKAGFHGYVAPLWSVADDLAKEISLGFYEASARGETVSEFLRKTRAKFAQTEDADAHTTWLAYLFYGHPAMKLSGPTKRESV